MYTNKLTMLAAIPQPVEDDFPFKVVHEAIPSVHVTAK
jgi:hypothetical protein